MFYFETATSVSLSYPLVIFPGVSLIILCMPESENGILSSRLKTGLSGNVIPGVWYCDFCTGADMPSTFHCAVPGCNGDARYNKELSFHTFPKVKRLRKQWIWKIRRDVGTYFKVSLYYRQHFITHQK